MPPKRRSSYKKLLLRQIEMDLADLPRSARYAHLAAIFRQPGTAGAYIYNSEDPDLAGEYWHLFQAAGHIQAQPYESVNLEGELMGESAANVVQAYSEAGLEINDGVQMPDHISLELAFMAFLSRQEEAQTTSSAIWRARQHRFLKQHLARWVGNFCDQILVNSTHPMFLDAAVSIKQLIAEDLRRFDQPLKYNRHPDIYLKLCTNSCTLCTLCADNCRQGALTVVCAPETLSLRFDPLRCNGCRACLRLCPESALTLVKNPPRSAPVHREAHILLEAQRVICPGCQHAHIARPWLERILVNLGESASMRASLELCPVCKASTQEVHFVQFRAVTESIPHG